MALLEIQVVVIQDEVSDLETNVDFLFDETGIQDERILTLEQTTDAINAELDLIDDEFITVDNELESELRETVRLNYFAGNKNDSLCLFTLMKFFQVSKPQSFL